MEDFLEDFLDDDPDRRGEERIPFEVIFEITSDKLKKPVFVIGDDISQGGIKFICRTSLLGEILSEEACQLLEEENQLTEGGSIKILFTPELHLNSEIRLVTPVNPDKGGWDVEKNRPLPKEKMEGYQICVEFVDLTEQQVNDLTEYINDLPEDDSLEF